MSVFLWWFLCSAGVRDLEDKTDDKALYLVGILAWLIPGGGHWYRGQRGRAGVMFVSVCVTFLLGLMLGGTEVIDPQNARAWFCGQILGGLPAIIATLVQDSAVSVGVGKGADWGQVYTGLAGLLNMFCVLDALVPDKK